MAYWGGEKAMKRHSWDFGLAFPDSGPRPAADILRPYDRGD